MDFEDIEKEIDDLLSIQHPGDKITPDRVKSATTLLFNSSRWEPFFITELLNGKILKKLDRYVGGFGEMPTSNIGNYLKDDGTFTNDPEEAADFAAEPGVLEYNDGFDI